LVGAKIHIDDSTEDFHTDTYKKARAVTYSFNIRTEIYQVKEDFHTDTYKKARAVTYSFSVRTEVCQVEVVV
jgi:uncharacterized protein YprB with RNaseH-like and TPR domain